MTWLSFQMYKMFVALTYPNGRDTHRSLTGPLQLCDQ